MTRVTVLIPTHDHGTTLLWSARSVLRQTHTDLELLIVGDGSPDVTREVVAELAAEDPRVRWFDNPKGERRGERHRAAALEHATGTVVAYLPDDDLWTRDHLEIAVPLLDDADFAHTAGAAYDVEGHLQLWPFDLRHASFRDLMRAGEQRIGHRSVVHTLDAYQRLPQGWVPAPEGASTDTSMWVQFIDQPWIRIAYDPRPTAFHLGSAARVGMTMAERTAESERLFRVLYDPSWRRADLQSDAYLAVLTRLATREAAWLQRPGARLDRWTRRRGVSWVYRAARALGTPLRRG
jgi:glycosyltransferase involved in cell wall biosynthesis